MKSLIDVSDYESPWFEEDVEYVLPMQIRKAGYRDEANLLMHAETIAYASAFVFERIVALRVERRFFELAFPWLPTYKEVRNLGRFLLRHSPYLRQFGFRQRGRENSLYLLESVKPVYYRRHCANYAVSEETRFWQWDRSGRWCEAQDD